MIFNSIDFAIFLPVVFTLYWLLQNQLRLQNLLILVSSYVFYGWWDYRFLSLMFFSSLVDYLLAIKIDNANLAQKEGLRKKLLYTSLIINLGMLGVFKYYNFFMDSFVDSFAFFGVPVEGRSLNIILPVGISFYTFQTLSYTIDVYRKKLIPTRNLIDFFAFVSFFPQLVAGPIERAIDLLPQFYRKRVFNASIVISGLRLILWGLFKKIVIADRLATYSDIVFNNPTEYTGVTVVVATLFFSFQIYCDFSAYSDIALGSARLLGFELMVNFKTPYFSTSIKEFWSRWHISLSSWFKDYVYIPLGGSKEGKFKWVRNLMITFLISGLWHGANITFVIWGFIHGLVNSIEALLAPKFKANNIKIPTLIAWLLTFSIVCFTWIFFRAKNVTDALILVANLPVGLGEQLSSIESFVASLGILGSNLSFACSFILFLMIEYLISVKGLDKLVISYPKPVRWGFYYGIILWIILFGAFDVAPQFIYFQF